MINTDIQTKPQWPVKALSYIYLKEVIKVWQIIHLFLYTDYDGYTKDITAPETVQKQLDFCLFYPGSVFMSCM